MTSRERGYSRVYYDVATDPKFVDVWGDDATFGLWVRLLMLADQTWPIPASIPRSADASSLQKLVDAGLIDERPGDCYIVHGLDAERGRRADAGRVGGLASGQSRRTKGTKRERPLNDRRTNVQRIGNEDEDEDEDEDKTKMTAVRSHPPANGQDDDDHLDVWYRLTARAPSRNATKWLDELATSYGEASLVAAMGLEHQVDSDPSTLLGRIRDRLWVVAHANDKAALKRHRERAQAEHEAIETMTPEQRAANLKRLRDAMVAAGLVAPGAS